MNSFWRNRSVQRAALALFAFAVMCAVPARAQVGVYVNYTATQISDRTINTTRTLYGPTAGLTYDAFDMGPISFAADFRGSYGIQSGANGASLATIQFGPRLGFKVKRLRPYGEFLIGFARYNDGYNKTNSKTTDAQYTLGAGVDWGLTKHVSWRVIDYDWSKNMANSGELNPRAYSTGIVFRF